MSTATSAQTPTKTDSIHIYRSTKFEQDVYDYALSAFQLLFAPRAVDPTAIPPDLTNFDSVYCSSDSDGCFLVARDTSLPSSSSPSTESKGRIVGIQAYRPYIHRHVDDAGNLRPELVWPGEKTVEVVRLFISPECRGKRLAQRLVERMVDEAREAGVKVLYLHTQPFLTGAEQLWGKMGWTLIGRDTDHWESIHMYRKL